MRKIFILFFLAIYAIGLNAQNSFSTDPFTERGIVYKNQTNAAKDSMMVTHSSSQDIVTGSVACSDQTTGNHTANSYWRVFDLANDFNITEDWNITSVDVGIESAVGATGEQPAKVRLHTLDGNFELANLTLLHEQDLTIYDGMAENVINFPLSSTVTVPANSILVYEFHTPDGQTDGHTFFIGSNPEAETDDSYISATDCGLDEPSTTSSIGFATMHIVMNLWGDAVGVTTNTVTFTVTDNDGSASIAGASIEIDGQTLTTDASGVATIDLADGTYDYTISAQNFVDVSGQAVVAGAALNIEVGMDDNGIDTPNASRINVYPNPSNGKFNVEVNGTYKVTVMNVAGEVVYNSTINNNSVIDLNEQAAGVYFMQLKSENQLINHRIMIK